MINDNSDFEKGNFTFLQAVKELKLGTLLRQAGIKKSQGASVMEIFKFLLLLAFQGKNLFRFLNSKRADSALSKNTYYRFLNEVSYHWRRFLSLLSSKVVTSFSKLTRPERIRVLVLDDSVISRNRSKQVELLARIYDHALCRFIKGFTMLTLGWSDGYSFLPVDFAMLSSAKEANRYQEVSGSVGKRTNGYKRRLEATGKKTEVAVQLIQNAVSQGIQADYVLMDTWFTTEPMIRDILATGLDVIGMVKELKQRYWYQGKPYTLSELRTLLPKNVNHAIPGSVVAQTKGGIRVKLVFVKNRNKKSEWLAILSTDLTLKEEEIIRTYGNRWSIEVFFKATKSLLKLGSEFQGRSYDMMISHTTIVFTRYTLLEWIRRKENDERSFGELFYLFCDDIQDMDITTALQNLMSLFIEQVKTVGGKASTAIKSQLQQWIDGQPLFIKALFAELSWES